MGQAHLPPVALPHYRRQRCLAIACYRPQHHNSHLGFYFLQEELHELRGDIEVDQARILGDCYGVEVCNRLLLDISGVYNAEALPEEDEPVPTLQRLEMAKRALRTGYTFPTNHYFVTNDLWQEFQEAIRQRKGTFSREQFVHPPVYYK